MTPPNPPADDAALTLERDYQIKRAMGFPPEVFTRIRGILRAPQRLPAPEN